MDGRDLAAVLVSGAEAAQLGTAFLRSPESGAHDTYKAALADPSFTTTAITRAFSGRRARGLLNNFMIENPSAPHGYPQINGATRPLRAEAARRGDPHHMSLWAGQGFQRARASPAADIIDRIMDEYFALDRTLAGYNLPKQS
jgi:nitronate monooxygenase